MFYHVPSRLFPQNFENTAIHSVFFNFSMFQCRWPIQTYIQEIHPKHCFSHCFFEVYQQKHKNLFCFFAIKPVQNTSFCIQRPFRVSLFKCFFSLFAGFSVAGSLPKWPKIPWQYPLKLRHRKAVEKSRTIRGPGRPWPRFPLPWDASSRCFFSHFPPKLGSVK